MKRSVLFCALLALASSCMAPPPPPPQDGDEPRQPPARMPIPKPPFANEEGRFHERGFEIDIRRRILEGDTPFDIGCGHQNGHFLYSWGRRVVANCDGMNGPNGAKSEVMRDALKRAMRVANRIPCKWPRKCAKFILPVYLGWQCRDVERDGETTHYAEASVQLKIVCLERERRPPPGGVPPNPNPGGMEEDEWEEFMREFRRVFDLPDDPPDPGDDAPRRRPRKAGMPVPKPPFVNELGEADQTNLGINIRSGMLEGRVPLDIRCGGRFGFNVYSWGRRPVDDCAPFDGPDDSRNDVLQDALSRAMQVAHRIPCRWPGRCKKVISLKYRGWRCTEVEIDGEPVNCAEAGVQIRVVCRRRTLDDVPGWIEPSPNPFGLDESEWEEVWGRLEEAPAPDEGGH